MVSLPDAAMGLLLGISAFLLAFSIVAYMRCGVKRMLFLSEGLGIHLSFTLLLIASAYATDWLDSADGWVLVFADAVVLLSVIVLGFFGGRGFAGSS